MPKIRCTTTLTPLESKFRLFLSRLLDLSRRRHIKPILIKNTLGKSLDLRLILFAQFIQLRRMQAVSYQFLFECGHFIHTLLLRLLKFIIIIRVKTFDLHHIEIPLVSANKRIMVLLYRRVFLRTLLDDFFFLLFLCFNTFGGATADITFRSEEQLMAESALTYRPLVFMNKLPDLCKDGQQAVVSFANPLKGSSYSLTLNLSSAISCFSWSSMYFLIVVSFRPTVLT